MAGKHSPVEVVCPH